MRDAEVQDCAKILVGMMRLKNPIEDTSLQKPGTIKMVYFRKVKNSS